VTERGIISQKGENERIKWGTVVKGHKNLVYRSKEKTLPRLKPAKNGGASLAKDQNIGGGISLRKLVYHGTFIFWKLKKRIRDAAHAKKPGRDIAEARKVRAGIEKGIQDSGGSGLLLRSAKKMDIRAEN